ncbi:MAG: ORF6N domain-containing protein [Deltaproteobacteria bacterium]|nr:ORF6N domain-containing protein [Deltaproteobacteria bacterium]
MGKEDLVPQEIIESKIFLIRGRKVMLDRDLSVLYGVTTGNLNKAVRRNWDRFPDDFLFQLTNQEVKDLIFQFGTSRWGGTRKLPYAFTENGVAMLSSILNSKRAIQVNIQIMRTFTRLREMMISHKDLARRLDNLEKKSDGQFKIFFDALRALMAPPMKPKRKITCFSLTTVPL